VFERVVGLSGDVLQIGLVHSPMTPLLRGEGILEDSSLRDAIATSLGNHLATVGGAGLIIDYGHLRSSTGDTLQAMKAHKFCAITDHIGDADLTSHVDFGSLGKAFSKGGAKIAGALSQGEFLNAMGLEQRTRVLTSRTDGEQQRNLVAASERLANPAQMGDLFKVMAVTAGLQGPPYPF